MQFDELSNTLPRNAIIEFVPAVYHVAHALTKAKRCEDVITAAAAYAGECVLRQARDFDFDRHTWNPGKPILSLKVSQLLSGDRSDWRDIPETSVFGSLRSLLIEHPTRPYPPDCFPDIAQISRRYAAARRNGVSKPDWGKAPLSVAESHYPSEGMLPIRAAFELRQIVDKKWGGENLSPEVLSTLATCSMLTVLIPAQQFIAPATAVLLAFETINAMAKTAPFLPKHMQQLVSAHQANQLQQVQ